MTPQEHTLLDDFLARLQAAGPVNKDPEANALIHARLDGQPDAAYLLVQRSLLMDRALAEANHQITALRQQLASATAGGGGSFLGGSSAVPEGFGRAPSQAYSPDPRYDQRPEQRYEQRYEQAPAQQPEQQGWRNRWFGGGAQQPQGQAAPAAAGPSFLGQAATTAAGVAGGMFLFNGIEHLIGGHGGSGNAGNAGGSNSLFGNNNNNGNDGGSLSGPMTENITENVYMQDRGQSQDRQGFLDDDNGNNDSWASGDDYSDGGDDQA